MKETATKSAWCVCWLLVSLGWVSAQLTQPDFEVETYRPLPFGTISL